MILSLSLVPLKLVLGVEVQGHAVGLKPLTLGLGLEYQGPGPRRPWSCTCLRFLVLVLNFRLLVSGLVLYL